MMMKTNSSNQGLKGPRGFGGSGSGSSQASAAEMLLKDKTAATEIRLLLHTSHAGGLIGKGGLRITQLREVLKNICKKFFNIFDKAHLMCLIKYRKRTPASRSTRSVPRRVRNASASSTASWIRSFMR